MAAVCWWPVWVMLNSLIRIAGATNCADIEFEGLDPTDQRVELKVDDYISIAANLTWISGCDADNSFHIKISYEDHGFTVDVCKLLLHNGCHSEYTCSPCRCLNERSILFYKKASRFDNRVYSWTLVNTRNPEMKRKRNITVSVINTEDRKCMNLIILLGCVCAAVVVVAVVLAITVAHCTKRNLSEGQETYDNPRHRQEDEMHMYTGLQSQQYENQARRFERCLGESASSTRGLSSEIPELPASSATPALPALSEIPALPASSEIPDTPAEAADYLHPV